MLRFVPIPTPNLGAENPCAYIDGSRRHWEPFLGKISRRSKESVEVLLNKIYTGTLQLGLVWSDDEKKAYAVLGFQYRKEGDDLICEIVHLTGRGFKEWKHLLPQLHRYMKDTNCAGVKTYCRLGLERFLEGGGYKKTHVIMEHRL